jgi:hypothetical protein
MKQSGANSYHNLLVVPLLSLNIYSSRIIASVRACMRVARAGAMSVESPFSLTRDMWRRGNLIVEQLVALLLTLAASSGKILCSYVL